MVSTIDLFDSEPLIGPISKFKRLTLRIHNDMHAVAFIADAASRDQVRAQWVVLGQVCSEVHLLPFELLPELFLPWESKLAQVPASDEVDLAVRGRLIHFIWVSLEARLDLVRVAAAVGSVMSQQEGVFFACEPSRVCWET